MKNTGRTTGKGRRLRKIGAAYCLAAMTAALGYFSRLDALLLLVWLAAALWRICLLAGVLRALWRLGCGQCPQDDDKGAQAK